MEYPPGWEPNNPPDDLDEHVYAECSDPAFMQEMTLAMEVNTEQPAPPDERCGEHLHTGPTGVWTCQRQRGHHGACFARGIVDV